MCGVCPNCKTYHANSEQVISFRKNILLLVVFCVSFAAIGLSCFALNRVWNATDELDYLKQTLSKIQFKAIEERMNNIDGNQKRDSYAEFLAYLGDSRPMLQRSKRSAEKVRRHSKSEKISNTNAKRIHNLNSEIVQTSENSEDHEIKRKSVDFDSDVETETFQPEEYPSQHDIRKYRHRGKKNQLEIIDEFSPQAGRLKSLIATHFDGDTSKYVYGHHSNFNGNGHLRHPKKTFVDWKESSWVNDLNTGSHFTMNEGIVTIKEEGLYFVYSQIYYLDEHDMNGYRIYRNSDIFLQCTTTSHSSERIMKGNTCYTAKVAYLDANDALSLSDITDGRYSLFEPGKSFFGIIKLGSPEKR